MDDWMSVSLYVCIHVTLITPLICEKCEINFQLKPRLMRTYQVHGSLTLEVPRAVLKPVACL